MNGIVSIHHRRNAILRNPRARQDADRLGHGNIAGILDRLQLGKF